MKSPIYSRSILLTGAAGFVGSNVLIYLFNKYPNYFFTVLDALTYSGDIKNIPDYIHKARNFQFVYGDVRNQKIVDSLISRVDTVLHFAAETHVARSIYDDAVFFETDILGTQCIASAVLKHRKNIKRFIHISTSEVYGTALKRTMDESHPLNPQSPYAAAKAGADRLIYSYITTYKLPIVIVRLFNIYGKQQHLEKLIPRFITSCILNEPLTIHGTGQSSRDFTYVDDISRALDSVAHADKNKVDGEDFNIGSGKDYTVRGIADLVMKIMARHPTGKNKEIQYSRHAIHIGDRPGQVFRHTASIKKIGNTLKWCPQVSFRDGLEKTVYWYVDNRAWWNEKVHMRHVPIETEGGKTELH